MLNIHMPTGWSSCRQLHAVWPWACHVLSQAVVSAVAKWGSLFATSGCALWKPTLVPPLGQW